MVGSLKGGPPYYKLINAGSNRAFYIPDLSTKSVALHFLNSHWSNVKTAVEKMESWSRTNHENEQKNISCPLPYKTECSTINGCDNTKKIEVKLHNTEKKSMFENLAGEAST